MAIFETFTLLFKADSAQIKKEIDDVKKKTEELTNTSKDSEEQTTKTDNEFDKLSKTLAKVAATYFSAASIIGGFRSTLSDTSGLAQFSLETGINIQQLDAWGKAVRNFGGDAATFRNSVLSFAKDFNTQPQVALDYFLKLSEQFEKIGSTKAQIYGQQFLGLDTSTIAFLVQGPKAIRAALAEQVKLGVVTEEDAKTTREFNTAVGKLSDAVDQLYRAFQSEILPGLTGFIDILTEVVSAFTFTDIDAYETPDWLDILSGRVPFYQKKVKPTEVTENVEPVNTSTGYNGDQVPLPPISGFSDSYQMPASYKNVPWVPPVIPQVTNSQARSLYVGSVNVNTTAQNTKEIANAVVGEIDRRSEFLNQIQQSNAYFDNAVVV